MTSEETDTSAAPTEQEIPETHIDTDDVEATITSADVHWQGTNTGQLNTMNWSGDVQLNLDQLEDDETTASVSAYFSPDTARELATAFRSGQSGTWETDNATIWVNRGWLYNEGPMRGKKGHRATLTLSEGRLTMQYDREDENHAVETTTELSGEERDVLADALEFCAGEADDYEPRDYSSPVESESRAARTLRFIIPTGITLGIVYGVGTVVTSRLNQADFTVNGEPVGVGPAPGAVLSIVAFAFLIMLGIQYGPGMVRRWH